MNEAEFNTRYKKLNRAQRQAVDTIDGPLLVVAGPGSGKTEILSLRVANILRKTDVYPSNILCLTFTDAAALNMRKRLEGVIGVDAYRVAIHTFHSFGLSVIERYPEFFYNGAEFLPADDLLQVEVLDEIFNSLAYNDPLRVEQPGKGFIYPRPALKSISALKKAGITPEEFKHVLDHNEAVISMLAPRVDEIFSKTLSAKVVPEIEAFRDECMSLEVPAFPVPHFEPLNIILARSLDLALKDYSATGKTAPLSAWKSAYTVKHGSARVLKAGEYLEKMESLARIYREYVKIMHAEGYFDYDDMILDVLSELERNEVLVAELQERYHYILVDEFQDTNDAQMRLLQLLTATPVHEGNPNIMAVGDDDQAIYKFQGAEISNILQFKKTYPSASIVTLTHNYRSTQAVLDVARHIIVQGAERLENLLPDVEKKLISANTSLETGDIRHLSYTTELSHYQAVADRIKTLLDSGAEAHEIAVIARRHQDLEKLVPFLHEAQVPFSYEREQDIFQEPHIHELILMTRFIDSLVRKEREEADYLLPTILCFPFWGLSRMAVWQLSLDARKEDDDGKSKLWITCMLESKEERLQQIAHFFLDLAKRAEYEPVEYILDSLVGAHTALAPDGDDEDGVDIDEEAAAGEFVSPYKDYYFPRERLHNNRAEYLRFLSSLKTFVRALREYKFGKLLKLSDFVHFIDLHEEHSLALNDTAPFENGHDAVALLTAHKAKGLEYETVIVLAGVDAVWAGKGIPNRLPFPMNLPITPAGENLDDQLRLFYVALTRAKRHLFIFSYRRGESGREQLPVQFLSSYPDLPREEHEATADGIRAELEVVVPGYHRPPFIKEEKALLRHLIEEYQLSATHFNNFLDVTQGGPGAFLEQNLLRFPQPKSKSGVYGSLMHHAIECLYIDFKKEKKLPEPERLLGYFDRDLSRSRLSIKDRTLLQERGHAGLAAFYEKKQEQFSMNDIIECDFRDQGVIVEGAHITGKIDRMARDGDTIHVYDLKTGKAALAWTESDIKLWRYKNQLLFYKLLVENSREFSGTTVTGATLEFIEPFDGEVIDLPFAYEKEDLERMKNLISIVCEKIRSLDFPDTSEYADTYKGIQAFEDDLLGGTI